MTAVTIVLGAWLAIGLVSTVALCLMARGLKGHKPPSKPDFLWGQPTDCLSAAAVDVRFREITAPLERDERRRKIEAVLRNQQRGAA